MKVCVLIPTLEYRGYAGARIRYGRLQKELASRDVHLELVDIESFDPRQMDADVLLISKCHDARSVVAAAALSQSGHLVGVDLFDDYFSQSFDSRLLRFRNWLNQLLPNCHFALCSSHAMAGLVGQYHPDLAVHVLNDPAEHADPADHASLGQKLAEKLGCLTDERRLRIGWFGVGDNPYFKVGLHDLAAYGSALSQLLRGGLDVELTILTNKRSLDASGLALITKLPVRANVEEWTEERERDLLSEVFACFLPVNSQGFSAAKSLNRAVTALSSGCQVISAGYPLYARLDHLIYRDIPSFLVDIAKGSMRHSQSCLGEFQVAMLEVASAAVEAQSLVEFLKTLTVSNGDEAQPIILIHGPVANPASHNMVQSFGGLSVASPYCASQLKFDVVFRVDLCRPSLLVGEGASCRVKEKMLTRLHGPVEDAGEKFWRLSDGDGEADYILSADGASLPIQIAVYPKAMEWIANHLERAFGPCRIIFAENLHWPIDVGANRAC